MTRRVCLCIIAVVAVCFGAAGCLPNTGVAQGKGAIVLAASIRKAPTASDALARIVLTLSNGGYTVTEEVPISGNAATATIEGLAAGLWLVEATACDSQGGAVYSGKAKAQVRRDSVTPVAVTLRALEGNIALQVSTDGLPGGVEAQKLDIHVYYAGGSAAYRVYSDLPVLAQCVTVEDSGYIPRSYDMRIVMKDSDGAVLYESEYVSFGIRPGKTTQIQWSPAFGTLQVYLDIAEMPSPPQSVEATVEGTQATVSWQPCGDGIVAYRVFWRYSEFDRYSSSRSQNIEAPSTTAVIGLSSQQKGSTVRFVVVARDALGQESLRSEEANLDLQ